jgi:Fe-S-cluster containining protein
MRDCCILARRVHARSKSKNVRRSVMSSKPSRAIRIAGADAAVLTETDLLQLSCTRTGCDSNCCKASAPIVLNPYEIELICRESSMSYGDMLDIVDTERANGFPLVMLPRNPVCHFWSVNGCRIYRARPLACRLFPIGRVYDGLRSRFVLPGRNMCGGLASQPERTVGDYLQVQEAARHITMADRWIEFVNEIELMPLPDKPVTSVAFHMIVYSPDAPPLPASGNDDVKKSPEERFILRLETAMEQLPRFLRN